MGLPNGGQRVLVVAPHPDDECLGCAGTIAQHLARGDSVWVLVFTDGRGSRALGYGPDEMARQRQQEATRAMSLLGVTDLIWMSLPESQWDADAGRAGLKHHYQDIQPDIVYAPCGLDYHPEHRKVAACLASVVTSGQVLRIYTLHVPLGTLTNLHVDVSDQQELISTLFKLYSSQQGSLLRGLRMRRYSAARHGATKAVEEFCQLIGLQYRRAHMSCAGEPRVYGMRYWAFTDLLCFIRGAGERKKFGRALALASVGTKG